MTVIAPPHPLDAQASDPVALGWMQGSPPPPDKLVRFADGSSRQFPQLRWSFCNQRQLVPTRVVPRGPGPVSVLPLALRDDLEAVRFTPLGRSETMSWSQSLAANYTDGIVVLHQGRIVFERYFGALKPEGQHIAMSVTKSVVGLLAATLIAEGALDEAAPVAALVPELKASAFGDATVRQLLDMSTALHYSEDYSNPEAEIFAYVRAGNVVARPADYQGPESFYEFLQTVQKQGEHGRAFAYKTVNTDVLAWVAHRATGRSIGELLAQRLWAPMGAEQDAYFAVDSHGTEFAGGGLNLTLRDLARVGETMRNGGRFNGRQIVPEAVVDDIRRSASPALFAHAGYALLPGWSYRNMWWVTHNAHGAYAARGVYGQAIYIDPAAQMVVARFASHPLAANANLDPTSLPAYQALAQHLIANS